jgi:hypothetical protein
MRISKTLRLKGIYLFYMILLLSGGSIVSVYTVNAQASYITTKKTAKNFVLAFSGKAAPVYVSDSDYPGVIRAVRNLQVDIKNVSEANVTLLDDKAPSAKEIVIIGTIGKSILIDKLISTQKLNVAAIAGKWETFLVQVVEKPMKGVDQALVIAGSDKRGTIFGIYDLSKQIGVSPWHWWADVPPKRSSSLYVLPGRYIQGEPPVKYRGIFLNDEEPALGRWAVEKYGGFNHVFYEKVFELILRMKGNYLWPAMWWASFNSDDPLNPILADEYGIVMGTTHHEPMMRAHAEWRKSGTGPWNYEKNEAILRQFWKEGIQRMASRESIVSLGMRGDGDMAMSDDTNIALLEKIVKDQRAIIQSVTGKEPTATPQLWALYKEVQDYYDKGMRVPDDVTLLLCDDNWGNIRKLPKPGDKPRAGGYGIYYHFDYVGGPRNYKWLNTNQIERTWEQMNLAYQYGANQIWIVNVGDIKPMEFPIEFFLDYAWNPKLWNQDNLDAYVYLWAERQFGSEHAAAIASILTDYTQYNARRKPELLSPETYSIIHYREAERVVEEYNKLLKEAERIDEAMPAEYKDAFYQLVLHPVKASAVLNELYVTVAKNRWYATQGRAGTNGLAERAKILYQQDSVLSHYYNKEMANGKWNHMMDQTHIGYTAWQQPEKNVMPAVKTITLPVAASLGVAIDGSDSWWPREKKHAVLPVFDALHQQFYYIDIFNRGQTFFDFTIQAAAPYITVSTKSGRVNNEQRVWILVDWKNVPPGKHQVPITITGAKSSITVLAIIDNIKPKITQPKTFVESNGYISIEAEHYARAIPSPRVQWKTIPNLGRTLSAVTTFPVTEKSEPITSASPHLEYGVYLADSSSVNLKVYLSPTLNFHNTTGLRFGISFDDETPQVINLHEDKSLKAWEQWVSDNVIVKVSRHSLQRQGYHTLKFWRIDPGVVLQKIVIETKETKPSYLGPPESYYLKK